MYDIFTLHPNARPKVMVVLPDNVLYKGNAGFINSRIIQLSNLKVQDFAFVGIDMPKKGKLKKAQIVETLQALLDYAEVYGITTIAVGIADFYKVLTGNDKFMLNFGRALNGTTVKVDKNTSLNLENFMIVPFMNPVILNRYPDKVTQVSRGLRTISLVLKGEYKDPIENLQLETNKIITDADEAINVLKSLFKHDKLFVDIETTGLNWYQHNLLTISFAIDEKNAWSFAIHQKYHSQQTETKMFKIFKQFFTQYKGTLVGHNWIGFDHAFIVHKILREENFDLPHEPLVNQNDMDDTMLMAYLLMNSTERPSIGLKELAFKYMGDWDSDIDQRYLERYPLEKVATYNNYDVIATCKIYNELWEQIEKEGLTSVYQEFKEIAYQLLKIKMVGLRIDMPKVLKFREELKEETVKDFKQLRANPYVKKAEEYLAIERMIKRNKTIKVKKNLKTDPEEFMEPFNPSSPKQKSYLFFELMNLPVINTSKKTKEPSTDAETLTTWINSTDLEEEKRETVRIIHDYMLAQKILSTYLENMITGCVEVARNDFRIFANFNQTSVISGRLSSSGVINMQTIPSASKYGKRVKELFIAPKNFVLATSDYSALEDRLIANESGDKNKIAIFQKGIDGHCLNAYSYFRDEMEDITEKLSYYEKYDTGFYKVTTDEGELFYIHESDPEFQKLKEKL